MMCSLG